MGFNLNESNSGYHSIGSISVLKVADVDIKKSFVIIEYWGDCEYRVSHLEQN
jgi:hypothetical protein